MDVVARAPSPRPCKQTAPTKLWALADAFQDRLDTCLDNLTKGGNVSQGTSKGLASKINVPPERQFVGLDAYGKAIESGADVIVDASPPAFRPHHFTRAVAAGKHVFMEKPLAVDAPGVRKLLAAGRLADEKGLKVGVGLQRHHQQPYIETINRIKDGELGKLMFLRAYWNTANPAKKPPEREGLTEMEYQLRDWYFFTWLSGDHICEQHIHNLDVCNWIMDAYPVEAQGMGGRQVRTSKDYGHIFDHHAVEFTYADGTKMFSQARQIPGCWRAVSEHAHGTKGASDVSKYSIQLDGKEEQRLKPPRGQKWANPYQVEHDDLVRRHPQQQALQRVGIRRPEHHDGHLRSHGHLFGQGCHLGRGHQFRTLPLARPPRLGRQTATSCPMKTASTPLPCPASPSLGKALSN